MFDGGGYAYVIREDDPATPPPAGARRRDRGQPLGEWRAVGGRTAADPAAGSAAVPDKPADAAGTPTAAIRAITAGATDAAATTIRASTPGKVRAEGMAGGGLDPSLAYGPDDPAYGPPAPGWYERRWQGSGSRDGDGEAMPARGPFEPLRSNDERDAVNSSGYRPAEDESAHAGHDHGDAPSAMLEYQPLDRDRPGALDSWAPSDPETGALGQIKDLYQAAETVSPAGFDSHFDQLLERQRQLISEYFSESGTATTAEPPSQVPPGFDSAESLSALRGELRGTP